MVAMVVHARSYGYDAADDDTTPTDDDGGGEGYVFEDGGGEGDGEAPPRIHIFWPIPDAPDIDNTLNLLSVISFTNPTTEFIPMMLGGNSHAAVLGQISGILELAEKIDAGEAIDPQRIYVPVGSGCAISGLIIGVVLVQHLKGGNVLRHAEFKFVGCNVHERKAFLNQMVGFHLHPFFSILPLTIIHTIKATCRALVEVGGAYILREDCTESTSCCHDYAGGGSGGGATATARCRHEAR